MMYQDLSSGQLFDWIQKLSEEHKSGFIFFSTPDDAWGKIKFHQGDVIGLGYRSVWGAPAIPMIQALETVKCYFQENNEGEGGRLPKRDPSLPGTPVLLSQLRKEPPPPDPVKETEQQIERQREVIEQEEQKEKKEARPPRKLGQKMILLVDDSQIARSSVAKPLELAGYLITEARDGFEAIGLASADPPDLMILDASMPLVDGYRVLEAIRYDRRLKHLPVIMLGADDGLFSRIKGKMADCQAFIEKPVDISRLLKLVRKHTQPGGG